MTIRAFIRTCLLTGSVLLTSCAYMQTHKNIEEVFRQHSGYHLAPDFQLLRAGDKYYLSINRISLRKIYPTIHDSIFLNKSNTPILEELAGTAEPVYKEISAGTATVLQQADGYAQLEVLKEELDNISSPWLDSRPAGAVSCKIKAQICGSSVTWAAENSATAIPVGARVLSTLDQVVIDWPGTILYNAAIPVMAPFVFFHEFLTEN